MPSHGILQAWEEATSLMPAQLFLPRIQAPGRLPVLVFLHGGGDGPFELMNTQSLPGLLASNESFRASFPFIGLFPCSTCSTVERGWVPANLMRVSTLISRLIKEHHADPHRVALTRQSMGGAGLWRYAAGAVAPHAPAVPRACRSGGPTLRPSPCCVHGGFGRCPCYFCRRC